MLKIFFPCNVEVPDGIAIDNVGRNIYWSYTGTNRIKVARLDWTKKKLKAKDGLDDPRAIVQVHYKTDCFLTRNVANHYRLEGPPKCPALKWLIESRHR